jgi:hypothetical protein
LLLALQARQELVHLESPVPKERSRLALPAQQQSERLELWMYFVVSNLALELEAFPA